MTLIFRNARCAALRFFGSLNHHALPHGLAVAAAQLHAVPIRQFPATPDDLVRQLCIRGMRDVLFLHGRVHHHFFFQRLVTVQPGRDFQYALHSSFADAFAEIDQIARIAGQLPLKLAHAAEVLPVGVLHPGRHHGLVALVEHLLEQEQADHQSHRFGRTAFRAVIFAKCLLELRPRQPVGQLFERLARVELLAQRRHQERGLIKRGSFGLHRSFRPAFATNIQISGRKCSHPLSCFSTLINPILNFSGATQ
jgi:hypothetical protein